MQALKTRILELLKSSPHSKSPEAEAEQILFHVMRVSNHSIRAPRDLSTQNPPVGPNEAMEALFIAESRASGVPLQHLLGYQFFYSHEYVIDSSTLIPRPETEILVDEVIRFVRKSPFSGTFRFAELGLGSGIISCEILSHFPDASGVASELNPKAIKLAKMNLENLLGAENSSRLKVLQSASPGTGFEIFETHAPFDLILSNPPYLCEADEIENEVLLHEPSSALFPLSGPKTGDPMYFYENLAGCAQALLKPGGAVFVEIPHERADAIEKLFLAAGSCQSRLIPDLSGRSRVLFVQWLLK